MRALSQFLKVLACASAAISADAQDAVEPAERDYREMPKDPHIKPPPPVPAGTLALAFPGAVTLTVEDLRTAIADQIKEIEENGLTKARADDAAFFLGQHYRHQGFAEAEVLWEIRGPQQLVLKVHEGPRTVIRKVFIHGNRAVSESTLLEHMLGPTRERFPDRENDFPFVEADIQTGVERVRGLYASQGFLDAVVSDPELSFRQRSVQVDVAIHIAEGMKYLWGDITFAGDPVFSREELMAQFGDLSTKPYTPDQVVRMQRDLEYFYKTRGYFNAVVTAASDPSQATGARVPAAFTIEPGIIHYFDGVTVTGLEQLDDDFFPHRFRNLHGQVYSPEKAQKKFRELMRTGLFKSLRLHEEPLPNGEVRLDLTAEEAKARELGFSIGFSTFEGGIGGVTWKDRSFLNQGRPLTIEAKMSQRGLLGEVLFVDPWFLQDRLTARFRLYGITREFDGYNKGEVGFRAEVARKLAEKWEISAFIQARDVALDAITFVPESGLLSELVGPESYSVSSIGLAQALDTRNSPLNPTSGMQFNAAVEAATPLLADGVSFVRASVSASYYRPIGKGVLAFGARAGIINALGDGVVPVDERYFNGGARSVRSFLERELGPTDAKGLPIGGEAMTLFKIEYTHPLFRSFDWAVFFDAGSVGRGGSFGVLRQGIGVGLRYKTPIGPLRLDYGLNPAPLPHESSGVFHLSIGTAF